MNAVFKVLTKGVSCTEMIPGSLCIEIRRRFVK